MTRYRGGYGIAPYGQTEYGGPKSDIEARFHTSRPHDKALNVPVNEWLTFTTYCYSSWIDIEDILLEISEDNGVSYSLAFDGTVFLPPYGGAHSKVRRTDGHTIKFWIEKVGDWPVSETVKIRFTGADEYGQQASKEIPVVWP